MTGQELTRLAMDAFGYRDPADLAKRLGLTAFSSPRRVKRWLDGEADPDYKATMALLEALDMIREPPSSGAAASEVSSDDLPRSFEGQVALLSQLMRETIAALRESRPADAATPGSPPRAARKAQ